MDQPGDEPVPRRDGAGQRAPPSLGWTSTPGGHSRTGERRWRAPPSGSDVRRILRERPCRRVRQVAQRWHLRHRARGRAVRVLAREPVPSRRSAIRRRNAARRIRRGSIWSYWHPLSRGSNLGDPGGESAARTPHLPSCRARPAPRERIKQSTQAEPSPPSRSALSSTEVRKPTWMPSIIAAATHRTSWSTKSGSSNPARRAPGGRRVLRRRRCTDAIAAAARVSIVKSPTDAVSSSARLPASARADGSVVTPMDRLEHGHSVLGATRSETDRSVYERLQQVRQIAQSDGRFCDASPGLAPGYVGGRDAFEAPT